MFSLRTFGGGGTMFTLYSAHDTPAPHARRSPAAAPAFSPLCPSLQKYVPLDLRSKKTRAIRRRLTKAQVCAAAAGAIVGIELCLWYPSCVEEGRQSATEPQAGVGGRQQHRCCMHALDAGCCVQLSGVATADASWMLGVVYSCWALPQRTLCFFNPPHCLACCPWLCFSYPSPPQPLISPCRPTPRLRRLPRRRAPSRCGSTRSRHEDLGGSTLQPCRHTR